MFKIKPLTTEFVNAVAELEKACFYMPWSGESIANEIENPQCIFLTAEINGELAGYIGMHFVLDEGYINNVAVSGNYRHKGVAKALIKRLIELSAEKGLLTITLEVRESNTVAINLYEGLNFAKVGLRKAYYTNPLENAVLMTLSL